MAIIVSRYIQGFKIVFLSVLVFSGMLGLQNCGEPDTPTYECTPDITVLLPEKVVSTFFFKEGSYWIYQREDGAYLDSIWVSKSSVGIYPVNTKAHPNFKGKKCYEAKQTIFTSLSGYIFENNEYFIQAAYPKETDDQNEEVFVVFDGWKKTRDSRIFCQRNQFEGLNDIGDSIFEIQSLVVSGKKYSNVVHYKKIAPRPYYLLEAYYAPGYGMIRTKDENDAWWNLVRYNIVQ